MRIDPKSRDVAALSNTLAMKDEISYQPSTYLRFSHVYEPRSKQNLLDMTLAPKFMNMAAHR